jgi:Ca2+-binding EF-hand superfamily protein
MFADLSMDKDKNGVVSRDEFFLFMRETFDRLDINRSGRLECNEVRQMTNPNWLHVGVNRPPKNG